MATPVRLRVLLLLLLALVGGGGGSSSQLLLLPTGCKQDGGGGGRLRSGKSSASADGGGGGGGKVVCSSLELAHVLPPDALPNRTVTLILSNNKISGLKNGSFAGLSLLERLDLRNNLISVIDAGAFVGLPSLKRLDLTNNQIGCLNADIFKGLANLVRLNLSGNLFSSLAQGTFDHLTSLKSLEFQTDYLLCDCNMLWMQQWLQERNITVRETRCIYPKSLQAQPVISVRQGLLTCDPPLELPSFYMTPSHRQVVFEGDSLPFQCMASYIDQDMQVLWYQDGKIVETDESQGIFVEKNRIHNCSLIASALTISNIQAGSTGNWGCHVHTRRGNNSRTVDIVVLNSSAQYCPPERVVNNKGDFRTNLYHQVPNESIRYIRRPIASWSLVLRTSSIETEIQNNEGENEPSQEQFGLKWKRWTLKPFYFYFICYMVLYCTVLIRVL